MRKEERENKIKKGNVICTKSLKEHSPILQFAGSTRGRMGAGGGRSAPLSMMVGDTELFRCGCTPSVVLFSVQYYVTEKTDACLKLLLTVISSMQGKEGGKEGEGEEEGGGNPAPIAPVSNSNPKDKMFTCCFRKRIHHYF